MVLNEGRVIKMDLGTFGAIMKFALEVENEVTSFYESAKELVEDQELAVLFDSLADRGQKRTKTIERVRRENVTEMILEPITGLDSETYKPVTAIPEDPDDGAIREVAVEIEKNLQSFYAQSALKIDFLSEVAYAFELLAEANEAASERLSS
jgi:rubrerythrin